MKSIENYKVSYYNIWIHNEKVISMKFLVDTWKNTHDYDDYDEMNVV